MEETKSPTSKTRRRTSKRKPLTDLGNVIPSSLPSSQSFSSSSLLKTQTKSSLSLALQSPQKNPNGNINSKANLRSVKSSTNDDDNDKKKQEKEKGKCQGNRANPSSVLSLPPKTPSALGTNDCVISEPCTVYRRRHTVEKRKSKGKGIIDPLSCSLEMRIPDLRKKKDGDGDISLSKSCPLPRKRKPRRQKAEVNPFKHDLPQDFIDKQRAYFAEIDAFELEEEVASAGESE